MAEFVHTKILDHGYLKLIETWGSDERIVEAARMSTGKGFIGWGSKCEACGGFDTQPQEPGTYNHIIYTCVACAGTGRTEDGTGDEKLLKYLYDNHHATPFEMAGMVVEVQAPIFVFREWHRHRTQSYNEMSARYMPLPDVNYVPTVERLMIGGGHLTKQAGTIKGADTLDETSANWFQVALLKQYDAAETLYQTALQVGVPKELARVHLPVGRYSRMRASANLRNWLAFLTLRMAPQAQWEIRQYANGLAEIIRTTFPRTMKLFDESR